MKNFFIPVLLTLTVGLTACLESEKKRDEKAESVQVDWSLTPQPAKVGAAQVQFKISDAAGLPVKSAKVEVEATMTHPGMPSQYLIAHETDAGTYRTYVDLTMAGDWVLLMNIHRTDGGVTKKTISLSNVK